jgi:hypothetical protein
MNIFGLRASRSIAIATANPAVLTAEPKPKEATMDAVTAIVNVEKEVVKDAKSFVGWFVKEEKKLAGAMPSIVKTSDTVLSYARMILPSILIAEGNAPAAAIAAGAVNIAQNIIDEAGRDLTAVQGVIFDAGSNPSVVSSIKSVQKNLSTLVTDAHIKSDKAIGIVTKVVNTLGELLSTLNPLQAVLGQSNS